MSRGGPRNVGAAAKRATPRRGTGRNFYALTRTTAGYRLCVVLGENDHSCSSSTVS